MTADQAARARAELERAARAHAAAQAAFDRAHDVPVVVGVGRGDWTAQEVKRAADALGVSVATLYDGLSVAGAGFEPATSGSRARHLYAVAS